MKQFLGSITTREHCKWICSRGHLSPEKNQLNIKFPVCLKREERNPQDFMTNSHLLWRDMAEQRHLLLDRVRHCILASTHNLQSYLKEKFQIYLVYCTYK